MNAETEEREATGWRKLGFLRDSSQVRCQWPHLEPAPCMGEATGLGAAVPGAGTGRAAL